MSGPRLPRAAWCTSSYSTGHGNCIEVAVGPDVVAVRDSKDRAGPVLVAGRAGWAALLGGIRRGELEPLT